MSKISVTTIAGLTSGGDANTVKIESGDDFVVDTDVLKVDSSNNRVGIGLTAPEQSLHVRNSSGNSVAILGQYGTGTKASLTAAANQVELKAHNGTNDIITVATGSTERVRIQSSGGISFNGDTAQVNALDDYEEGTWTPTVLYYDGTLTIESADYVKVGQLVHVNMYVSFSNTSDGSDILFDGLPYTVAGDGNNHYSLLTAHSNGNMPNFHLRAQGTTTQMRGVYLANSNGDNKPSYNNVANKFIIMGGTYRCTP